MTTAATTATTATAPGEHIAQAHELAQLHAQDARHAANALRVTAPAAIDLAGKADAAAARAEAHAIAIARMPRRPQYTACADRSLIATQAEKGYAQDLYRQAIAKI